MKIASCNSLEVVVATAKVLYAKLLLEWIIGSMFTATIVTREWRIWHSDLEG